MDPNVAAVLLVILTCLATHRVTRLLTRDHLPLIAIPRERLIFWLDPPVKRDGEMIDPPPKRPLGIFGWSVAFLMECDWCMSVWVSGALVAAEVYAFHLPVPYPLLLWPVASTITGLVANTEPDE
jgi:hypothetical protein